MLKYIIADQNQESVSDLKLMLQKIDQQTEILYPTSGHDLLDLAFSEKPDLIFVNLEWPGSNGIEICQQLKADHSVNSIPVILFGNQSAQQKFQEPILESGAEAFLSFPFNELTLSLQLSTLLKSKRSVTATKECIADQEPKKTSELENEKLYRNLVERLPDGVYKSTHSGKFIEVNPAMFNMLGYNSREELLAVDIKKDLYFLPEDRESIILMEKYEEMGIFRMRKKDGSEIWVEDHGWYTLDNDGEILFHEGIIRDITERRLTEEILKESEKIHRNLVERLPDGVYKSTHSGKFVEVNPAMVNMLGYSSREELLAVVIKKDLYFLPEDRESNILMEKYEEMGIFRMRKKDGSEIWVEDHGWYTLDNDGEILFHEGIMRDITERRLTEEILKESEKIHRNLVERLPDGVYKSTHSGEFIEVNPAMVNMLGYSSREELLAVDIKKDLYFLPEDRESNILMEKYEEMGIFRMRKKDGSEIWVEDHGWYTTDNNGEILFHEGIMRDITERKKSEEALKESEERFKMLFDKAPIGYQSLDENGLLIEVNETWLEMMGYRKEEVIGCWFGNFLAPHYLDLYLNLFAILKSEGKIHAEFEMIKKDRSVITIEIEGRIGLTNDGIFKHSHCAMSDITDRRISEKVIADERILLRTLIDNIPDLIYVKDTSGHKIISNKADLAFMGFTDEKEVIGKTDLELFDQTITEHTCTDDLSVIQTSKPIINKLEYFPDKNGVQRCISTSKVPLTNDSGEIIGLVGVGHDMTREKQTEQKLIQLSKGIEQSPACIIITDILGNIEFVNQKFIETTGYTFEEVKGKNPRILQSGYTTEEEYSKLWNTITSGNEYRGEIRNRKRNGELFWESVLISPIRDESGEIVNYMAIKEDITNRKKTDLEILKLSVAIDQNPASVVITDTRGVIEYVNNKFLSVSGYLQTELIGKVIRILKPGHTTDEIHIEIWNRLFAGRDWRGEHLNRTKNKVKYWESVLISPIKNREGQITNYIILSEDISERKIMEKDLIAAKEKAEESDRLKSAFLANMSHEIRTPLNSILGFSDLLTDPYLDPEFRKEFAELINSSGNNLLSIINDVLDISKIEAGQITLTENEFSAQRMISIIQKEYSLRASSKGIELRLVPLASDEKIIVFSDEMRIKQVLINFIGNALKFTDSGYIEIGVKLVNKNIQFHVKDTGIGIKKEFHDKVFERFRQVEAAHTRKYGGNGLGLAITKNLVELLGGKIWLESEPAKGSTFFFSLPESSLVKMEE